MFKYFVKKTLRNRSFVFWACLFPLALMTCFNFAFANLYTDSASFDPVKAMYVNEDSVSVSSIIRNQSDQAFESLDILFYGFMFEMVVNETDCFEITKANTIDEARAALNRGDIKMILIVKDRDVRIELCENYSTMEANIATAFLTTFKSEYKVLREMIFNPDLKGTIRNDFSMKEIAKQKENVYGETPDPFNWYYYATIVMGIMFNIVTGIGIVADAQADVSAGAMRTSLSSTKKSILILNMFAARLIICFVITIFQIIVANIAFKIPIGNRIPELMLFVLVGNMFALSLGLVFGLFLKGKVSDRENKANAILMASVFLGGEMINTLPGVFEQNCPIINEINPATILNFAFYKLVYYENLNTFYMNIIKIVAITVVCLVISIVRMRRQKYASI